MSNRCRSSNVIFAAAVCISETSVLSSLIFIHKQEKLFTVQLFYVYVVITVHLTRSSNYPSIFTKATMRRNRLLPCVKTDVAIKRAFQRKLPILFAAETNSRHCKPIDCQ